MLGKTSKILIYICLFVIIILFLGCPSMPEEFSVNLAPTLSSPTNGTKNVQQSTTLIWQPTPGADNYGLQVSTDNSFSNFIINQTGLISTSKVITGLSNETIYYWRVNSNNSFGTSNWSNVWSFTTGINIATPDVPILSTPTNGSQGINLLPTLTWNPSNGASSYTLQVSTINSFTNLVYVQNNITTTSKQVNELNPSTKYFWRVNAGNSHGTSSWSTVWSFTTKDTIPDIPTLIMPTDSSIDVETTPTFSWNPSKFASEYNLQISTSKSFSNLAYIVSGIKTTSIEIAILNLSTLYYWRVNATNNAGASEWSSIWSFTTEAIPTGGLVAYYPFNGNANDEINNGKNGIVHGATLTTDRYGNDNKAYYFDGSSNYINSSCSIFPSADRTISLWFYTDSYNRGVPFAYGGGSCGTTWFECVNNNTQLYISSHCGANTVKIDYSTLEINTWYNWTITTSSNGTNFYLNGELIGTSSLYVKNTNVNNKEFSIGVDVNSNGIAPYTDSNVKYFKGKIDDIRVFNRELNLYEIQAIYHEGGW